MADVTQILAAFGQGDPRAPTPLVYAELRGLAARSPAQEKPGQTLQATAPVNEAYLRLVAGRRRPPVGRPRPLLRGCRQTDRRRSLTPVDSLGVVQFPNAAR